MIVIVGLVIRIYLYLYIHGFKSNLYVKYMLFMYMITIIYRCFKKNGIPSALRYVAGGSKQAYEHHRFINNNLSTKLKTLIILDLLLRISLYLYVFGFSVNLYSLYVSMVFTSSMIYHTYVHYRFITKFRKHVL